MSDRQTWVLPPSDLLEEEPARARMSRRAKVGVLALAALGVGVVGAAIDESAPDPTLAPAVAAVGTDAPSVSPEASAPAAETVPTTVADAVASAGPVPETTVPPVADTAAPPPPPAPPLPPDPGLVDICVVFTPVAAFMSMPAYQQIWNDAGQNQDTLRANCAAMSTEQLTAISAEMQSVQAFFAAATTAPPVAPAPQPTLPLPTLPPAAPPTAAPLPVAAPLGCDPNYSGCVPIDSDVDCAGGSGNGPSYLSGTVQVIGTDIYDLDRDRNGIACD